MPAKKKKYLRNKDGRINDVIVEEPATIPISSLIQKEIEKVSHPQHYNLGQIEVIDVLEDWDHLPWNIRTAIKHLSRAGYKDPADEITDLQKAQFYINDRIMRIEQGKKNLVKTTIWQNRNTIF